MYWIHPSKKFTKCVPRHCSIMVDGQEIICCKWQWQELAYSLNLCYINSGGKLTTQSSSKTPVHTPNVMQDEASKLQWHPPVKEKLCISCQSHSTMQFNKQTLEHCPIILNGRLPSHLPLFHTNLFLIANGIVELPSDLLTLTSDLMHSNLPMSARHFQETCTLTSFTICKEIHTLKNLP